MLLRTKLALPAWIVHRVCRKELVVVITAECTGKTTDTDGIYFITAGWCEINTPASYIQIYESIEFRSFSLTDYIPPLETYKLHYVRYYSMHTT